MTELLKSFRHMIVLRNYLWDSYRGLLINKAIAGKVRVAKYLYRNAQQAVWSMLEMIPAEYKQLAY